MSGTSSSRAISLLLAVAAAVAVSAPVGLALRVIEAGVPELAVDGDHALIDLATRQAAEGRRLLGPYSRLGFHHPGPALFYLYAPFHALFDGRYLALCLAVLLLALACLGVILGVLGTGGAARRVAAGGLALGLLLIYLEPSVLASPWNPHALLLPLIAAQVALAAVATGDSRWLPVGVVLGSLAAQSHLAVVVPVAVAGAVAVLGFLCTPEGLRRPLRTPGVIALALALVLWAPVALEALLERGGNPGAIAASLATPRTPLPPAQAATRVLERLGSPLLVPWGVTARNPLGGPAEIAGAWPGLALLTAVAATVLALRGPERRLARALAAIAAGCTATAIPSIAAAGTLAEDHVVRWIALLGVLALLAAAACLPSGVGRRRSADAVLILALTAVTAVSWVSVLRWSDISDLLAAPTIRRNRVLGEVAAAACVAAGSRRPTLVLEHPADWGVAAAVASRLADHGIGFAIDRSWALLFDTAPRPALSDLRLGLVRTPVDEVLTVQDGLHLVRLELSVPPPSPFPVADPGALRWLLDGFGAPEGSGRDAFRWSAGDLSRLALRLPEGTARSILALELRPAGNRRRPQSVAVSVDGLPAGEAVLDPVDHRWYRFPIPRGSPGRVVEVEVRYAWTVRPRDTGGSFEDTREIAVSWRRLALEPAIPVGTAPPQPPAASTTAATPAAASARTTSSGSTPASTRTLSRPLPPATTLARSLPTPTSSASSASTARLARPRSGGALTSSLSAPPCGPSRRSARPPGLTRSRSPAPSARLETPTASPSTALSRAKG